MKILVVSHTFLPVMGGAEIGIHEIYNRLGERNDVYILTAKPRGKYLEQYGVKDIFFCNTNYEIINFVNTYKTPHRLYKFLGGIVPPFSLSMALATIKQIRKIRPDVVNFHFFTHTGWALILTRLLTRIPIVLSMVGREDVISHAPFFWKVYIRFLIKFANVVTQNSKYYLREFFTPKKKTIPYGVDTKRFNPNINSNIVKNKLGISKESFVLFTVQRLSGEKKIDITLRAFKYVALKYESVYLIIAGKGPEEKKLMALSKELDLEDKIFFTGYVDEDNLPKYFAACDIFVFNSISETFGVIFPQAFASGKPVVAASSTAVPEVVENNVTGLLTESMNPEEFSQGIIKLIDNANLRRKLSKNARKEALNKYDWSLIADKYEEIFVQLLTSA